MLIINITVAVIIILIIMQKVKFLGGICQLTKLGSGHTTVDKLNNNFKCVENGEQYVQLWCFCLKQKLPFIDHFLVLSGSLHTFGKL